MKSLYLPIIAVMLVNSPLAQALNLEYKFTKEGGKTLTEGVLVQTFEVPEPFRGQLEQCRNDLAVLEALVDWNFAKSVKVVVSLESEISGNSVASIEIGKIDISAQTFDVLPNDEQIRKTYFDRGVAARLFGATIGGSGSTAGHCDDVGQRALDDFRMEVRERRAKLSNYTSPDAVLDALGK